MTDQLDPSDELDDMTFQDGGGAEVAELARGTSIGRYTVLELLGRGAMGAVYKAFDPELDRSIALKVLSPHSSGSESTIQAHGRLMREAQGLAQLSHPNVVAVFDVGRYEGSVFIAMELVEGKTGRDWLQAGRPSRREVLEVFRQAGEGLLAAHQAGLVHRDFKPANMILGQDGRVRVADFGLVRSLNAPPPPAMEPSVRSDSVGMEIAPRRESPLETGKSLSASLTLSGRIQGTPHYMSPEQYEGKAIDGRTDQYSFCVCLFEALYGERPFEGQDLNELMDNVVKGRRTEPAGAVGVPSWLKDILLKGLALDPADRYPSMRELLNALATDPEEAAQRAREARRRSLKHAGMGAVLATGVAVLAGVFLSRGRELCRGGENLLSTVWNDEAKAKVRSAFVATGKSYATDTFGRVEAHLDRCASEWVSMHREACEATRVRGDQSEHILDLKMACLEDRLDKMGALVDLFIKSADETLVQRATAASASLCDLKACQDREALTSDQPELARPEIRPQVESIRKRLNRLQAMELAGKIKQGLEVAEETLQQATAIDAPSLKASALYWYGYFLDGAGEYAKADSILQEAIKAAVKAKDGLLAGQALVVRMWVIGYQLQDHEKASQLISATEIALGFGRKSPVVLALFNNTLGSLCYRAERYPEALNYYKKAYELNRSALGESHPKLGTNLNNIGLTLSSMKNWEEARQYYQLALDVYQRAVGPEHPLVAVTHYNLGLLYNNFEQPKQALMEFGRSLAIDQATFGHAHPKVAETLAMMALITISIGEVENAIDLYKRAESICREIDCLSISDSLGDCQFRLAQGLWESAKYREKAMALARDARESLSKLSTGQKDLAELDAWLALREPRGISSKKTSPSP